MSINKNVFLQSKPIQIFTALSTYLFGIIFTLLGMILVLLHEPLYGLACLLIGIISTPTTSKLFTHAFPALFSAPLKLIYCAAIFSAVILSISTFGQPTYDKHERITDSRLAMLSEHPIRTIKINHLDYYYIEKGTGDTILLLHGFPDMANTWDESITELSKHYRVIAPFLRGYFPTSIPQNSDYSVKTIAQDMVSLLDALSIEQYTVLGQDWGASIAFSAANLAPNNIKKLISLSIPHPISLKPSAQLFYAGRHFFLLSTGDFGARYARKNNFHYIDELYQRWSPDYKQFQESSNAIKDTFKYPGRLEAATGYYVSFANDQKSDQLAQFYATLPTVPVLFLVGENDAIAQPEIIQSMRDTMPVGSKTVVFKDAGHFLHREVFSEYIKEVTFFLK